MEICEGIWNKKEGIWKSGRAFGKVVVLLESRRALEKVGGYLKKWEGI